MRTTPSRCMYELPPEQGHSLVQWGQRLSIAQRHAQNYLWNEDTSLISWAQPSCCRQHSVTTSAQTEFRGSIQLDALVVGGLVGNWHSPGSHLHAVKEHARKDESGEYTGFLWDRGRRQGKRLATQLTIIQCYHASCYYHTQKLLPRKERQKTQLHFITSCCNLTSVTEAQGIGMDRSTNHTIDKFTNLPAAILLWPLTGHHLQILAVEK